MLQWVSNSTTQHWLWKAQPAFFAARIQGGTKSILGKEQGSWRGGPGIKETFQSFSPPPCSVLLGMVPRSTEASPHPPDPRVTASNCATGGSANLNGSDYRRVTNSQPKLFLRMERKCIASSRWPEELTKRKSPPPTPANTAHAE